MKRITFHSPTAQKIYDDYFKRSKRCIQILSEADQLELLMEMNSHVYEATHNAPVENEVEVLMDALNKLGMPEEVLKPLVAERKSRQAARTFNPRHILQALYLNISNGFGYLILAVVYLLIFVFGMLIFFKIFLPEDTGLFTNHGHFVGFGYIIGRPAGTIERLGIWFIPSVILIMTLGYFLNTLLLRLLKRN